MTGHWTSQQRKANRPDRVGTPQGRWRVGAAIAILVQVQGAFAQGSGASSKPSSAPPALPAVVVSATRSEKSLLDAPVRTEVVDRVELERTGARTLTDALQNIPGLLLQEVHGKSGYQLSLQGFTGDQVLVLIDGLPITASTGSTVDLSQYLVGDVERIEVVKGAASALFGSSAMGGVINVITRPVARGFGGSALGEVGSRGDQNASGRSADAAVRHVRASLEGGGDLRGRFTVDHVGDDGFAVDPAGWSRQGDRIGRTQIAARGEWQPAGWQRYVAELSHYDERDTQRYQYFAPPNYVPQGKTEDIDRNRLVASGRWRGTAGQFTLKGVHESYDSHSHEYSSGALVNDRIADQRMSHLSAQYDLPSWQRQLWQFGLDLHHDSLDQTNNGTPEVTGGGSGKVSRSSVEFHAQDDIVLGERWEVVPGLRWQRDSDFGGKFAPKLSLRGRVYEAGEQSLTVRASVGNGYRVPNLTERHYLFDHRSLGYVVIGNPALKPESSTSLQLGAAWQRDRRLSFDLNAYYNRARDLIQTDTTNAAVLDGIAYYTYKNVARARTSGLEASVDWQPDPHWQLRAALTLAQTRDETTGTELTRQPRRSARIGVDWLPGARHTLSLRSRFQGSTLVDTGSGGRSPGFGVVDLRYQYAMTPDLMAYLSVDNVLGRQRDFSNANDFGPISGRLVLIGLRYRFGNRAGG